MKNYELINDFISLYYQNQVTLSKDVWYSGKTVSEELSFEIFKIYSQIAMNCRPLLSLDRAHRYEDTNMIYGIRNK